MAIPVGKGGHIDRRRTMGAGAGASEVVGRVSSSSRKIGEPICSASSTRVAASTEARTMTDPNLAEVIQRAKS